MAISVSTTLVLGAGASAPYGMPTGAQLLRRVLFTTQHLSSHTRRALDFPPDTSEAFNTALSTSGYQSVDAFLEWRPRWAEFGKLAMAAALLESERQAIPALFPRANTKPPPDNWLQELWTKIAAPTWTTFRKQPIRFVTFNYDRLVEHYLYSLIKTRFDVRFRTFARWLPLVHVHGSLGAYSPHQAGHFGDVAKASASIKIVHEAGSDAPQVQVARDFIDAADRVLFLGFGYNETNLARIGITPQTNERRREIKYGGPPRQFVSGTHKGILKNDWERLCSRLAFWEPAAKQACSKCSDLIRRWL